MQGDVGLEGFRHAGSSEYAMMKSIGKSNAELRFVYPNNPPTNTDPTNGYLKNLSKMHRYHKWVPMLVFLSPWQMAIDVSADGLSH